MSKVLVVVAMLLGTVVASSRTPTAAQPLAEVTAEFVDTSGTVAGLGVPVLVGTPPSVVTDGSLVDVTFPSVPTESIPRLRSVREVRLAYHGFVRLRAAPGLWLVIEHRGRDDGEYTVVAVGATRTDPDSIGRFQRVIPYRTAEAVFTQEVRRAVSMAGRQMEIDRVFLAVPLLEVDAKRLIALVAEIER